MGEHSRRIRSIVKSSAFLGRLPDAAFEALLSKGRLKACAKGESAYRRGDPGNSLMVLTAGRIKLSNMVATKEIVLHFVAVGEVFGEVAALDGKERAVDAIALEDSEVFVIQRRDLVQALTKHPHAMLEIIRALCERMRLGALLFEDMTLQMRARAAKGLLRLARQHGRRRKDGIHVDLAISREELGKFLGLSRSNVSRMLGELRNANVIAFDKTQIIVTDEQGLAAVAEPDPTKDWA